MLPATLQFLIVMIASTINDRLQRKLDYVEEERRILREQLEAATGGHFPERASRDVRLHAGNARAGRIHKSPGRFMTPTYHAVFTVWSIASAWMLPRST